MKRWFSPPIQWLLWLGGLLCLGAAAWNLAQLRLMVTEPTSSANMNVQIPDAVVLNGPAIETYTNLVNAPLFWERRAIPPIELPPPVAELAPPVVETVAPPEPPPPPLEPPVGRLVGIVGVGDKRYALVRTEEKRLSLHKGEQWDGWTVAEIKPGLLKLRAGEQSHEVKLISDFAAPTENKQMANSRKAEQQRQQMALMRQQQAQQVQQAQQAAAEAAAIPAVQPAVEGAAAGEAAQVMSIKEALEARQRLMASRWGGLTGEPTLPDGIQPSGAPAARPQ